MSRALACISGYKDRMVTRSMLGSFEGYITYIIRSSTPFRTVSYVWSFLRNNFDVQIVNAIKGMKILLDNSGVIFDLMEDVKELFEQTFESYIAREPNTNFSFEVNSLIKLLGSGYST